MNYTNANFSSQKEEIPALSHEEKTNFINLLKSNKGKKVTIYMSFPLSDIKEKSFSGILEETENDYIILSNPTTGKWNMLFMLFMSYIEFDEKINLD